MAKYGVQARYLPPGDSNVPANYDYKANVAILGDFHFDSQKPLAYQNRFPIPLNAGNFDGLLDKLKPVISIELDGKSETLEFTSMKDFSNEALTEKIESLKKLALIKKYLVNAKAQIALKKNSEPEVVKKLVEEIKSPTRG